MRQRAERGLECHACLILTDRRFEPLSLEQVSEKRLSRISQADRGCATCILDVARSGGSALVFDAETGVAFALVEPALAMPYDLAGHSPQSVRMPGSRRRYSPASLRINSSLRF